MKEIDLLFFLAIILFACQGRQADISIHQKFKGEDLAIQQAGKMFNAIGGTESWCQLRSLYILANHNEPQMDLPYQSEIWRAMDTFQVVIEQQNEEFHVRAVFTPKGGTIRYLDDRDTLRILSEEQLLDWKFGHEHNVYVLLHKLGCNQSEYEVRIEDDGRLNFYQDTTYVVGFGLDTLDRPYLFYPPQPDGSVGGSVFTHWGTDNRLVHSAGGHPFDSSFFYLTEKWTPSERSMEEAFGKEIFDLDDIQN